MTKWNPIIKSTVVDGNIESIYLVFNGVERAAETAHFVRNTDGARLLIDVNEDDLPIAIQFVKRFTPADISSQPEIAEDQFQAIITRLHSFATQMIAYHLSNNEAKTKTLVRQVLDQARSIAVHERKKAA